MLSLSVCLCLPLRSTPTLKRLVLMAISHSEVDAGAIEMAGDVNLFFNDHDDPHSAEIEIMIAGKHEY